jgi:hypothetical protein
MIPGAGGLGWYWHLVEAELGKQGYDAFAVDLPAADENKGLQAYADAVIAAVGDRSVAIVASRSARSRRRWSGSGSPPDRWCS